MELGEEVGRGVRAVLYAYGDADVAKITNADVPPNWLVEETRLTSAAMHAGAMAPRRPRLVEIGTTTALVAERIDGPSMWQRLVEAPELAADLGIELAHVQAELSLVRPSFEMPSQRDRIVSKVHAAAKRHGRFLLRALDLLPSDSGPLVLCHGDLHQRNVILPPRGRPVLVDWFDASRGSIVGDIARTSLVLEDSLEIAPVNGEVPAASIETLRRTYLDAAFELTGVDPTALEPWIVVQGVARLAEAFGEHRMDSLRKLLGPA